MNCAFRKIPVIQSLCNNLRYKAGKNKPKSSSNKSSTCKKQPLPGKELERAGFWRKISLFAVIPGIIGLSALIFATKTEHERPPFVKYDYLRLRHKRFAWGDGTKSLFHNPHVNPLVDGYEDELDEEHEDRPKDTSAKKTN